MSGGHAAPSGASPLRSGRAYSQPRFLAVRGQGSWARVLSDPRVQTPGQCFWGALCRFRTSVETLALPCDCFPGPQSAEFCPSVASGRGCQEYPGECPDPLLPGGPGQLWGALSPPRPHPVVCVASLLRSCGQPCSLRPCPRSLQDRPSVGGSGPAGPMGV